MIVLLAFTIVAAPPSFERDVAPIFVEHCLSCHNAKTKKGGYDLSSYEAMNRPGKTGPAFVAGKAGESLLVRMMTGDAEPTMPKGSDLLEAKTVAIVRDWVNAGAKFDGKNPKARIYELTTPDPRESAEPTLIHRPVPILALAFHQKKPLLAASIRGGISFWEAGKKSDFASIPTKAERIHKLQFSKDGNKLLFAGGVPGRYGEVCVWDFASKKLRTLGTSKDVFSDAEFSPDEKLVAAVGAEKILFVWESDTGKLLSQVENHAEAVWSVAFHPDGKRIATASRDKSVKVWDRTSKEVVNVFDEHRGAVMDVQFSPDGERLTSLASDGMIRTFRLKDSRQSRINDAHAGGGFDLAPRIKDGFISVGADRHLRLINPKGEIERTIDLKTPWWYSVAEAQGWIAAGNADGEVVLFRPDDPKSHIRWQPWREAGNP